jgi:uncharacterized protein Usg
MTNNTLSDMLMFKIICDGNKENGYTFFLYLASIMNFAENNNGGCLSEEGVKSLRLNVLPYVDKLKTGKPKLLTQKELVSFLLNVLNSYYVSLLAIKLFKFYNENETQFLQLYNFPSDVVKDFKYLEENIEKQIPTLKRFLDAWSEFLDGKYIKIFNEEKTKGFHKHIFDSNSFMPFDIV